MNIRLVLLVLVLIQTCVSFENFLSRLKLLRVEKRDSQLIQQKFADTLEDVVLHTKRYIRYEVLHQNQPSKTDKPVVVVVGSGWSAHALLKTIETDEFRVICVSPRPYFTFTPMLASAAVGTVEYRSIVESVRSSNPFTEYLEGEIRPTTTGELNIGPKPLQRQGRGSEWKQREWKQSASDK